MKRGALISNCGRYRYTLWRMWDERPIVGFCCLNPSIADAKVDDPSFTRMVNFARAWGYGGVLVTNLFAWRATDPRDMLAAEDPVGRDNDAVLRISYQECTITVAAWGTQGTHRGRDAAVRKMLPNLHYLRLTKGGHPGHPLYLPAHLKPVPWIEGEEL